MFIDELKQLGFESDGELIAYVYQRLNRQLTDNQRLVGSGLPCDIVHFSDGAKGVVITPVHIIRLVDGQLESDPPCKWQRRGFKLEYWRCR